MKGYLATLQSRGAALLEKGVRRRDTSTFYVVWDGFTHNELSLCSAPFFDIAIVYVKEHFKEAHRLLSTLISEEVEVTPEFEAAAERIADQFASLRLELQSLKDNVVHSDGSIDFEKLSDVAGAIRQFSASLRGENHPIFLSKRIDKQTQKQNEYNCKLHIDNCWKCLTHSSEVPERDAEYDPWNGDHLRAWRRLIRRSDAIFEELFPRSTARKPPDGRSESALALLDAGDEMKPPSPPLESEPAPSVASSAGDAQDETIRALKKEIRQLKRQVRDLMLQLDDEKEKNRINAERLRKASSKKTEMELQQENVHLKDKIRDQSANIETLKGSIAHLQALLRYRAGVENDAALEENAELRKRSEMLEIEVEKLKEQMQEQSYRDESVMKLGMMNEAPAGQALSTQYRLLQEQVFQLEKQLGEMNTENLWLRKRAAKKRQYKQDAKVALEGRAQLLEAKEQERAAFEKKLRVLADVQQNNTNLKNQLVVLQKKLDGMRRSSFDHTAETEGEKLRLEDKIADLKKNEEELNRTLNMERRANADLTTEVQKLETERGKLRDLLKQKDDEIETLSDQLHAADATQQKFDDLQKSTSKLRQSQNLSEQKILDYEMRLAEMNKIKAENETLTKKLEAAEEKAKTNKAKVTDQEKLLKEQEAKIRELETEADLLKTKSGEQERLLKKLTKEKSGDQDEKMRQMIQEKDDLYSQLVSSKAISMDLIKLQAELDEKDDEIAALKVQIAREGTINKDLAEQVHDLSQKLKNRKRNDTDDQVEELNEQIQSLIAENQGAKKTIKSLQQKLDELEDQRTNLQPKLDQMKAKLSDEQQKVAELQSELETKTAELSEMRDESVTKEKALAKEIKKLKKALAENDDTGDNDQEITELRDQVQLLQAQLEDMENEKNSNDAKSSALKRKLSQSKARVSELEQEHEEKDETIREVQAELAKSKKTIQQLRNARQEDVDGKLRDALAEIDDLKAQSAEYYEAYSQLRTENNEIRAEMERLQTRMEFFDPLKESIRKYKSVSKKYYQLKQVIDNADEGVALIEVNGKERDREEVEQRLSELSAEHDDLFRELNEASQKCAQKEFFIMERLDADLQEDLALAYDYIKQLRTQIVDLMSASPETEEPDERLRDMSTQLATLQEQFNQAELSIRTFEQEMDVKPKKKSDLAKRIINLKRIMKDRTSFQLYPREGSEE